MKRKIIFLSLICMTLITCGCNKKEETKPDNPSVSQVEQTGNFNVDIIKKTKRDNNYLISPYSMEMAFNMLKEGSDNNTKNEIEKVIPTRKMNDISIKDRVKIANSLFINNEYKNKTKQSFTDTLVKNYNAEILYDDFKNPDAINKWVDTHTDGMIKKLLDDISSDTVLVLINAIAIDVEWSSEFECNKTTSEEFTKKDNQKINVEMMHNNYSTNSYKYLENEDAKGIVIPYKTYNSKTGNVDNNGDKQLEFIGILPNKDINSYIDNLTNEKLDDLFKSPKNASSKYEINLSLPRFKYAYRIPNFKEILINMGIKDAFNSEKADFTKIMDKADMKNNLYVSEVIHKTYIDLNEKGTKAAAVTAIVIKDAAAIKDDDKETVDIKFNKPFIYMIRDSKTKEILFFGTVYEPNVWSGSTCSK